MAASVNKTRPRRTAGKRAPPRRDLDRQSVIDAALAEIDATGAESFNLRNLARRLGVYPTAIYWYVPSKNELLAEVVGAVFRNVAPPVRGGDWRDYLRVLFNRYRDSIKQHPNVGPLVAAHLIGNLGIGFDFVEGLLVALQDAGLAGPDLTAGYNAVFASLIGFVIQEFSPVPQQETRAWQTAVQRRLAHVDPAVHPVLAANLHFLTNKAFILRWQSGGEVPLNQSFELFIDQVIAGIEFLAARSHPTRSRPAKGRG